MVVLELIWNKSILDPLVRVHLWNLMGSFKGTHLDFDASFFIYIYIYIYIYIHTVLIFVFQNSVHLAQIYTSFYTKKASSKNLIFLLLTRQSGNINNEGPSNPVSPEASLSLNPPLFIFIDKILVSLALFLIIAIYTVYLIGEWYLAGILLNCVKSYEIC